jgi:hypothetical protein
VTPVSKYSRTIGRKRLVFGADVGQTDGVTTDAVGQVTDRASTPPRRGNHMNPKYMATVDCDSNDRPREIHNWKKPSEVFAKLLESDASIA